MNEIRWKMNEIRWKMNENSGKKKTFKFWTTDN